VEVRGAVGEPVEQAWEQGERRVAAALKRRGLLAGGTSGAVAYLAMSIAIAGAPHRLAVAAAIPALALAPRLMANGRPRIGAARGLRETALMCAVSLVIVGATLMTSRAAGPCHRGRRRRVPDAEPDARRGRSRA
jgi:hypothetical protein